MLCPQQSASQRFNQRCAGRKDNVRGCARVPWSHAPGKLAVAIVSQALGGAWGAGTAVPRPLLERGSGQTPSLLAQEPEEPKPINKRHELNKTLAFSRVKGVFGHSAIPSTPTEEKKGRITISVCHYLLLPRDILKDQISPRLRVWEQNSVPCTAPLKPTNLF